MTLKLSVVDSRRAVVGREAPSVRVPNQKAEGRNPNQSLRRIVSALGRGNRDLTVCIAAAGLATQPRSRLRYASTRQADAPRGEVFRSEPVRLCQAGSHLVAPKIPLDRTESKWIKAEQMAGCVEIRMTGHDRN